MVAEVASKAIAEVEAEFDAKEAAKAKVRRRPLEIRGTEVLQISNSWY